MKILVSPRVEMIREVIEVHSVAPSRVAGYEIDCAPGQHRSFPGQRTTVPK